MRQRVFLGSANSVTRLRMFRFRAQEYGMRIPGGRSWWSAIVS